MKKTIFTLFVMLITCLSVSAESTICMFMKSMSNTDTEVSIDGQIVCGLNGTVKRTINPGFGLILPFETREACYRKIIINKEEKVIVSVSFVYTNASNGNKTTYKAEYPLDLEDGETYYLQVVAKGLNDTQIKEPKEKDVKKWLKKWEELSSVTL